MHAILNATGYREELQPLIAGRPSPLFRIAGKPIIVHIIEVLIKQGLNQLDLLLHHRPELIEKECGDGSRWGIPIRYHLVKTPVARVSGLPLTLLSNEQILLGQADLLPGLIPEMLGSKNPVTLFMRNEKEWTDWGLISTASLRSIPSHTPLPEIPSHFSRTANRQFVSVILSTRSFKDIQSCNHKVLNQQVPVGLLPTTGKMIEPGVWISRGVMLHPNATVVPPVFIGEHSQVHSSAKIGPHVMIEDHCIIDKASEVKNSVICEHSYVGEHLVVRNCLIDREHLINVTLDTHIASTDHHILSDLSHPTLKRFILRTLQQLVAILLIIPLSPIALYQLSRNQWHYRPVVVLPASHSPSAWQSKWWSDLKPDLRCGSWRIGRLVPLLWNVVRGVGNFVGLPPRSSEELLALPNDWREGILDGRVGLIALAHLDKRTELDLDQQYISELFHIANISIRYDLKLLLRFFLKMFQ